MKTGAIIQARMSSSRLPGKVLKELPYGSGVTVLEQVVARIERCIKVDEVIIATSTENEDKKIIELAEKKNIKCYAGSLDNVLERYYQAATKYKLDIIVRITGDCPCIDPDIVDMVIEKHIQNNVDFTTLGAIKRTFPHGIDAAVINYKSLKEAYESAEHNYEKEHVTTFFYKTHPEKYKIQSIEAEKKYYCPDLRLTLDTREDYILLCAVYDHLYSDDNNFGLSGIIELLEQKPWIKEINAGIKQKKEA